MLQPALPHYLWPLHPTAAPSNSPASASSLGLPTPLGCTRPQPSPTSTTLALTTRPWGRYSPPLPPPLFPHLPSSPPSPSSHNPSFLPSPFLTCHALSHGSPWPSKRFSFSGPHSLPFLSAPAAPTFQAQRFPGGKELLMDSGTQEGRSPPARLATRPLHSQAQAQARDSCWPSVHSGASRLPL